MKSFVLFAVTAAAIAQDGAALFRARCAVPYCHGQAGSAGRAPKLIGHTYNSSAVFSIVSGGLPAKGMPGFDRDLTAEEIEAVTRYVMTFAGAGPRKNEWGISSRTQLTPELERSRNLFFDAARMNGCGRCHEVDGWGSKVGPDLSRSASWNLRGGSGKGVVTARIGAETFPALVLEPGSVTRLWDLGSRLPVLRTVAGADLQTDAASRWDHAAETRAYSDAELQLIRPFLQWARKQQPDAR
ncbi:MAG: cytochrome c [Acidimicrobiia bacterium]|nr:cytochrome c [Acidimicrobiia bacterium]